MEKIEQIEEEEQKPWWTPLKIILAILLALLIIMMVIPYYGVKLDPNPEKIPTIDDVVSEWKIENYSTKINSKEDYVNFIKAEEVKLVADKIASISCEGNKVCQAKAMYYFVRNNYDYISDPQEREYIEDPREFLSVGGGDCESGSIALASLLEAIGIRTQIVFVPGHAYLRIFLPLALKRYKLEDNWVYLDWTCKICDFGEIPSQYINKNAFYLDV